MIDVTITHGSSGGPLLNMKGEVIGITMGGIEGTRFGFAIPINDAIPLLRRLPDFSETQMGQAIEELTIQDIIDRVANAVAFVTAEITKPLEDFLPERVLGYELDVTEDPERLTEFQQLRDNDFEVEGAVSIRDNGSHVRIMVFDMVSQDIAQDAVTLLSRPVISESVELVTQKTIVIGEISVRVVIQYNLIEMCVCPPGAVSVWSCDRPCRMEWVRFRITGNLYWSFTDLAFKAGYYLTFAEGDYSVDDINEGLPL